LGVTAYMGTPSWLVSLLKKAEEMGVGRAAIKLRSAFVTAEPLAPSDRAALVNDYGLTVVNAYATGELGVLAYDLEGNPALHLVAEPIIQLVDRDTGAAVGPGEAGEIVVTNLNDTYPLIRFGTGDLALSLDPAPGASRQDERMIRLVGRVGDAVKVRGMFVHPNQMRAALAPLGVMQWQAIVRRPGARDELTLRIAGPVSVENTAVLSAVRDLCRVQVDHFEQVESLGDQAGKIVDERVWA
jgi:phenylacetate-CoA ligase